MNKRGPSSNFKRAGKRGIALIAVLTVSVILLALSAAFFAAHKADLQLMGTSQKLEKTKNAALSAAQFVQYRLENDRTFGAVSFAKMDNLPTAYPPQGDPLLTLQYFGTGNDPRKNVIKGTMVASGLTFEVRLLNNLDSDLVGYHPLGEVPPKTARVWITAKQGQVTKKMDFILKRSPFSSVGMVAGGDVRVELSASDGKWWLGSRQPGGAGVRAVGTVTGQEVLSKGGAAIQFEPPDGLAAKIKPPYGTIQGAHLNMVMNGQLVRDVRSDDARLDEVKDTIAGTLLPQSANFEVPKLSANKLASPNVVFSAPSNNVTFKTEKVGDKFVHSIYEDGQLKQTYDGTDSNKRIYTWPVDSKVPMVTFDLEAKTMAVAADVEVETSGNFSLNSFATGGAPQSQPTLILGNQNEAASLKAEGINIWGSVGGLGALKAGKGDLRVRALSSLSTTPDFGVALHSESNVVLSKPGTSSTDGIPADWDAFAKAYNSESQPKELTNWAVQDDSVKQQQAERFSNMSLSSAGEYTTSNDPVWLGLTHDYPADAEAVAAYKSWMQPAVWGPDPNATTGGSGTASTSTGGSTGIFTSSGTGIISTTGTIGTTGTTGTGGTTTTTTTGTATTGPALPPPDIMLVPPGPGVNMERYVRLREYLKTVKAGAPDTSWLNPSSDAVKAQRKQDVRELIKNQISSYQLAAGQVAKDLDGHVVLEWKGLDTYFRPGRSNPFLSGFNADMHFRGLIYAGKSFFFDTQNKGIEVEGAIVSRENTRITRATGARITYNSDLLENLFATNQGDLSVKLERSFWSYY